MLHYAAIVPHPPLAIPSAGKEHAEQFNATQNAYKRIGEEIRALEVDTVLVISPHGERYEDTLTIDLHDPYTLSLRGFGDMATQATYKPDLKLIDTLQRSLRAEGLRSTMATNNELDYGASIPLLLLQPYCEGMKAIVIHPPAHNAKLQLSFGAAVRDVVDHVPQRVAVLCSADLSHRLSEISHGGIHPDAKAFDEKIRHALVSRNRTGLVNIDEAEINEMETNGLDSLRLFLGLMRDSQYTVEELSYEHPFGIGHATMIAHLGRG